MSRYVIVSIASGILFGAMDGLINANPLAQELYEAYAPITKASIDAVSGIVIDLAYGFVMAGIFLLLYRSLAGKAGLMKGISYSLIIWFFRVVMYVASQWMTVNVPAIILAYALLTGFVEMLVIGILYGLMLRPTT